MKQIEYDDSFSALQIFPNEVTKNNKTEIGSAQMLLNQFPSLLASKELSQAYKVVLPKGVAGKLMEIKNGSLAGLNSTTIVDPSTGKIIGQAGLQSLSNLANPLAVFTAMSMITGQYFMAQINNSIKELSENIEEVQHQIDASEESVVFSNTIFLQEIKNDWNLILCSETYKNSIISNVIKSVNDLTSSIYYFENRLNSKMKELQDVLSKDRIAEKTLLEEIARNKEFMKSAYELRSCLKLILIYLTSCITKDNATEIKETLKKDDNLLFSSTVKQLNQKIDSIVDDLKHASTIKLQQQASEIKELAIGIRTLTRESYNDSVKLNIDKTIDKIETIDKNGQTFYIEGDKLYIEE